MIPARKRQYSKLMPRTKVKHRVNPEVSVLKAPPPLKPRQNPVGKIWDGMWEGRRCFVVGGGKSLEGFDWELLKGELVIGINRSYETFPPSIMFGMDSRYFNWIDKELMYRSEGSKLPTAEDKIQARIIKQKYMDLRCPIVYMRDGTERIPRNTIVLQANKEKLTEKFSEGILHGGNSGLGALNIALNLGANPIYMLGFDLHSKQGEKQEHFHSGYPQRQDSAVYKQFVTNFNKYSESAKARADIVNLNPESSLKCFRLSDWDTEITSKPERPIVVSYYTSNEYKKFADVMEQSAIKFGLETDVQEIPSRGSWKANTYHKASFLAEMLKKHSGRNILWLDADSELLAYPDLFDNPDYDLAVHYHDWPDRRGRELMSGTLLLVNEPHVRDLIDEWTELNAKNIDNQDVPWGQKNLESVLETKFDTIRTMVLPEPYCRTDQMGEGKTVVQQKQASRKLRYQ